MALEDVVHVLRKVHRALRDGGVLLDIHPVPVDPWVDVLRGDRRMELGHLDGSVANELIRASRRELASVKREGMFATRGRRYFDWQAHYPTLEDWFGRREEYGWTTVIPPDLLRRIRQEMRRPGTTFVVSERTGATLLTKRHPSGRRG